MTTTLTMTRAVCLVAALILTVQAQAGCKVTAAQQQKPALETVAPGHYLEMVYHPSFDGAATLQPVNDEWSQAAIVGLWEFEVRATMDEGPFHKGDLLDWGLATWHEDSTEIQFSAGRPYDAGDVCMGVWKQTGRARFHLNHIALGKDLATGSNFDGLTNIRADVTVDSKGETYTGSYQIIQYSGDPTTGTEFDETTMQYQFLGTVTAKRVTAE